MTPTTRELVSHFESAAQEAREAEASLRKRMAEEIGRVERERAFAFRRARLVQLLATSVNGTEDEPTALAAQAQAVCDEMGFSMDNASHKELLDKLQPVGRAVWQCACVSEGESEVAPTYAALQDFEKWFEESRGRSFYTLFERYIPDTPVVDF